MSSATPGGDEHINGSAVALSVEPEEARAATETEPAAETAPTAAETAPTAAETAPAGPAPAGEAPPEPRRRDIWRRLLAVAVVLVAAFAVVVLWARPAHEPAALPLEPTAGTAVGAVVLNPTDLAFLQLMISLDNSALPLFELVKGEPALAAAAAAGADGHRAELVALRAALTAGGGVENPAEHAGHDLPGMVLDADLAVVRDAPADQRAAKAAAVLREHLAGTVALATSEGKAGADPATKAAAAQVIDAHNKLLALLPTV